jgi:hypothetical protein
MNSMGELLEEAIDKVDREEDDAAEEKTNLLVRRKLESIYRKHNREKLGSIDEILRKYKGKEEDLLKAVREKYCANKKGRLDKNNAEDRQEEWWSFVLKNYCMYERQGAGRDDDSRRKIQRHNWNVDESLNCVRNDLDELAESIGGTCVVDVSTKGGTRRLIVRKAKAGKNMSVTTQQVEKTVEKMREIVHARYRQPSNLSSDEKKHSRKKRGGNRK